ncbi:hypothetical protein EV182_008314 [Spiromyces aspiralis]|uniref:Uncharacterized protein n=1 Tax=Spiromyces aspiralis TaxID=68401 RepID=A0ACC1HLZ0_9FUNG|nr:hypothetical protein EV182_008314 [Spiromyces aspiralis]
MLLKLRQKKHLDAVNTLKDVDEDADIDVHIFILNYVHPTVDHLICDKPTAHYMWNVLEMHYNKVMMASAMDMYAEFANAKLTPGESVSDFAAQICDVHRKLKELSYDLDNFKVLSLLRALLKEYEAIVMTIVAKEKKEWDFESITLALIETQHQLCRYNEDD